MRDRERHTVLGATIGLLSGLVALGVGQLVAGLIDGSTAPIIVVGGTAIDATPEWLKSFAIRTFGSNDKAVLLAGIAGILVLAAIVLGVVSIRRPRAGVVGLVVLGAIGAAAALTRPTHSLGDALPAIAGAAAGIVAFLWLRRAADFSRQPALAATPAPTGEGQAPPEPSTFDRRRFLFAGAIVAGVGATAGLTGRSLIRRAEAAANAARAALRIPGVVSPAPPIPAGADLEVPGVSPFITPNTDFYRVDTALVVPSVDADGWQLQVHGMVDRPLTLTYDQLLDRPLIERDITLTCVSNEVGGRYLGNARWIGVSLRDLLDEAGVQTGADQMVSRSTDGFTTGTPASVALDGRDAMLAIAMNGEPLPLAHGFPVRMIVPGLYGYESACKWIEEIELSTYQAFSAYWVRRGWAEQALIQTSSRIDTPKRSSALRAGPVPIAGVAWAQHRGIRGVEVQIDDGPWSPATLGEVTTSDTWRQWVYEWDATPGTHTLSVRATDGDGVLQASEEASPFPSGSTGLHEISVSVR